MDTFFKILGDICGALSVIIVVCIIVCWITSSMEILHYTKQNNVLLRELCIENGLNVDSLINTTQNDTLNLKTDLNGK